MLRAAPVLVLALVAAPANADTVLYATAATTGGTPGQIGLSGYCVRAGGALDATPVVTVPTAANAPSRVVTLRTPPDPSLPVEHQFLYVAQNDRVQVFEIGASGELTPRGRIPALPLETDPDAGLLGMNPYDLDIAYAADGSGPVLYVPQRAFNRIATFPLDPTTGLSTVPTSDALGEPQSDQTGSSCVLSPEPSELQDVRVRNGLVYAARGTLPGDVLVYQLAPNGNFADGQVVVTETIPSSFNPDQCADERCNQNGKSYPVTSTDCTAAIPLTDVDGVIIRPPASEANPNPSPLTARGQIEPYARRRRLNGASSLILNDDVIYVSERFRRAISALELCPAGGEPPVCPNRSALEKGDPCTCPDANEDGTPDVTDLCPPGGFATDPKINADGVCTNRFRQKRLNGKRGGRTFADIRYNAMALAQGMQATTLLGSQFLDGRIDGYRLKSDGRLPRSPTRRTIGNVRTTPFRIFVYRPADVRREESAGVVYVGAGDVNRVEAYRLDRNGLPKDRAPFSRTEVLADTFPNDVVVVELSGRCG